MFGSVVPQFVRFGSMFGSGTLRFVRFGTMFGSVQFMFGFCSVRPFGTMFGSVICSVRFGSVKKWFGRGVGWTFSPMMALIGAILPWRLGY